LARKKDRIRLKGRPLFVSPYKDPHTTGSKPLLFPTEKDPHTLFVSNIAKEVEEEELRALFGKVNVELSHFNVLYVHVVLMLFDSMDR
jgi:hypothetical protein